MNFETKIDTTRRYVITNVDTNQTVLKVLAKQGAQDVQVVVGWAFLPTVLPGELSVEVGRVLLEAGSFVCRPAR